MANYIAIIELHDAENEGDFQQLDAAMQERRFLPQIRDDDGKAYWLPLAATQAPRRPELTLGIAVSKPK